MTMSTLELSAHQKLQAAEAAIAANDDIEAARDLAEERRNVEAQLTAAGNMLRKSLDVQTVARNESQAAEQEVERAADAILEAETQVEFEEFDNEYEALLCKAKRVASYIPASSLDIRIGDFRTQRMREIVDKLLTAPDLLHTPIAGESWPSAYAARRAALIAGAQEAQPAACAA